MKNLEQFQTTDFSNKGLPQVRWVAGENVILVGDLGEKHLVLASNSNERVIDAGFVELLPGKLVIYEGSDSLAIEGNNENRPMSLVKWGIWAEKQGVALKAY